MTAATVQGGKNVNASQWGRLLGLHPAPPQTRQSHLRTGNKEFSKGAVMIQHWKTVLFPGVAQLCFNDQLPFRSAFMSLMSPENINTPLCRWWKEQSSCRFVMIKLCWWLGLINVIVKIWMELRKIIHHFHRLKETKSPWRNYVSRLWEHNYKHVHFYYNTWCPSFSAAGWNKMASSGML